jgi:hypothetical protein
MRRTVVWAGAAVALSSCAGVATGGGGSQGGDPDEINAAEIGTYPYDDTYQIVQSARPAWLRPRIAGTFSTGGPVLPEIFVDGTWFGPIETLSRVRSATIERIEFIGATDATTLYGTGYMGGVIHVYTRR